MAYEWRRSSSSVVDVCFSVTESSARLRPVHLPGIKRFSGGPPTSTASCDRRHPTFRSVGRRQGSLSRSAEQRSGTAAQWTRDGQDGRPPTTSAGDGTSVGGGGGGDDDDDVDDAAADIGDDKRRRPAAGARLKTNWATVRR